MCKVCDCRAGSAGIREGKEGCRAEAEARGTEVAYGAERIVLELRK